MCNDDLLFDKNLTKGLSTVITLKVVLDNIEINIESLKKEISNIASNYPYIIDCYFNIYINDFLGIEKIEKEINQLIVLVKEFRFGVSLKIPIIHIFFSALDNYEKLFRIVTKYNDIYGFMNLVAVIKLQSIENYEQVIMRCREFANRNFMSFKTLFYLECIKEYPIVLSIIKKIQCLLYNREFDFWVYLGKGFSQKPEWCEKNIISILKLPCLLMENINLLPTGIVDILYCAKKISSIDFFTKKDVTCYAKQLIRFVVFSRNSSYIFDCKEGIFNQESSMDINENLVRFIIKNIKLFFNSNESNVAAAKVRTAMSDFIDHEVI
jgi:hypothetical protein